MEVNYPYFHGSDSFCSVIRPGLSPRAVSTLKGQITKLSAFRMPPIQNEKTFAAVPEYTVDRF
jgi:hypothetical protein